MLFSYKEYADMHFVYGFCNGNTTAAVEEYRLRYPRRRIPDRRVFTHVHQHLREKGSFPSVNRHAECQVQRNVEDDEHIIGMVQRTIESNYQHRFSVNVWCGVIGDQLIGPYIFAQCLTGAIYANFLQDEMPALLENVPLQTRLQMYYQHDGAPPHFSQVVRQ